MKKIFLLLIACVFMGATPIENCSVTVDGKTIPLYGRVEVVQSHADFNVQVVNSHEDLRVEVVQSHPTQCGRWEFVKSHPDFTICYVNSHPDFTVRFVQSHPGVN